MRPFLRSVTVLAGSVAMAATMATLGAGAAHATQTGEIDFTSPALYRWTAPAGVDSAEIVLRGAQGGSQTASDGTTTPGGNGALVEAEVPIVAGQTYTVIVGGEGGSVTDAVGEVLGGAGGYGFGGGGVGAVGTDCHASGGGGGETAFFSGEQIDYPMFVAGAGGGARFQMRGGNGDVPNGDPGTSVDPDPSHAAGGGTQSVGGVPGVGTDGGNNFASVGDYQQGGRGGADGCNGGGGGGAGYYGGGGGAGDGSGGAGSSYVTPWADLYNGLTSSIGGNGSVSLLFGTAVAPQPIVAPALQLTAGEFAATQYSATGWPQPLLAATGALPPGMTMDNSGVLSGTPTKAGTYMMTVNAYNEAGLTSWVEEVDVAPGLPSKVTLTPATASATVGTAFAHDPVAHVTDSVGDPIAGCSVSFVDYDGLVSFAAADASSPHAISVTTDANGNADPGTVVAGSTKGTARITALCEKRLAAAAFKATAARTAPAFDPATPPAAQVGHPFALTYGTEGTPRPTVQLLSGRLPNGLVLSSAGALTGTPAAAGRFHFTLQATNGVGTAAKLVQTIKVAAASKISVASTSANEGNVGTRTRAIAVRLSAPAIADVTVHWVTADGTATAGSDYLATSGTVTIPAGQTSAVISVVIDGDRRVEGNETFFVNLGGAANATVTTPHVVQTIVNDDHA